MASIETNLSRRPHWSSSADSSAEFDVTPARYTAIKHILAYVDGTENDRAVLDHALEVARRFISHIDVLHVRFDAGRGYEPYLDRLLDLPVERAIAEAATRACRHFEDWQVQRKLHCARADRQSRAPLHCGAKSSDMRTKSLRSWVA